MALDLHRLLRIARRWWWLLVLGPVLGGATAWYVSSQQPEMFASDVTLLVSDGVSTTNATTVQASQDLTETYSQWAVARHILERSIETVGYDGNVEDLQDAVSAQAVPDTLFIRISAESHDPEEAAAIANAVAEQFLLDVQQQTNLQDSQLRTDLTTQIDETSARLADVQDRIDTLQGEPDRTEAERDELAALFDEEAQLQADLAQQKTSLRNLDVEIAAAQTRIVILARAVPAIHPFAPQIVRTTIIGTVAGLAIVIAATVVLEYLDDSIRDRYELARLAKAPVLASVNDVTTIRHGTGLFVLDHPASSASEAMRLLRTNLEFASAPAPLRALAISSPHSAEGKSTITANLGVVLAQAGLKTVIIDGDLRHPSQHRIFGVENQRGLSNLLVSPGSSWREGVTPLTIPNLALIPSGPIPPNPADLLSLDQFDTILEAIDEWADVVLIDTPPLLAASDALIVASTATGLLLVCRDRVTTGTALRQAVATLQHGHARVIGVVRNRAKSDYIDHYGRYHVMESTAAQQTSFFGRSLRPEHTEPGSGPLKKVS